MDPENRWCRMAFGANIIKEKYGISDDETVQHIKESPRQKRKDNHHDDDSGAGSDSNGEESGSRWRKETSDIQRSSKERVSAVC